MNKKGFTLIELLAVIVILAIIALIATPAVLSIIEDSKESAAKDSAMVIAKAAETYYLSNVTLQGGKASTIDLTSDTLNYKGEKPEKGYVEFDEKGNAYLKMYINGYCIVSDYDNTVVADKVDSDECTMKSVEPAQSYKDGTPILFDPVRNEVCETSIGSTVGTNDGCMQWYIFLSENSETAKLLLDHNTTAYSKWNSKESGRTPDVVNEQLATDITNWHNDVKGTARLISADEVYEIAPPNQDWYINDYTTYYSLHTGLIGNENSYRGPAGTNKYAWLFINTDGCYEYGCSKEEDGIYGYWTSDFASSNFAWVVTHTGFLNNTVVNNVDFMGVRPVIEVPKSILEN